jgi:glutathione S-transferase
MSLADIAAASHVSVLDYFGDAPWREYPASKLWYSKIKSRPSFRPLLQDRWPASRGPPTMTTGFLIAAQAARRAWLHWRRP